MSITHTMMSPLALIPTPSHRDHLSSSHRVLADQTSLTTYRFSQLSFQDTTTRRKRTTSVIRMGGGPRTFPGGVSKWQWKRMQAKKSKQLLKARLSRERQIYEMRKRAELRAAVTELERPWEVVERAPTLLSVSADEQLKVLADRFQKPGGYDMWSERDGPQIFHTAQGDDLLSSRFFPKGVVHSVKPYGRVTDLDVVDGFQGDKQQQLSSDSIANGGRKGTSSRRSRNLLSGGQRGGGGGRGKLESQEEPRYHPSLGASTSNGSTKNLRRISSGREERKKPDMELSRSNNVDRRQKISESLSGGRPGKRYPRGSLGNEGNGRDGRLMNSNGSESQSQSQSQSTKFVTEGRMGVPLGQRSRGGGNSARHKGVSRRSKASHATKVYDMSLKDDCSYAFQTNQKKKEHLLSAGYDYLMEDDP